MKIRTYRRGKTTPINVRLYAEERERLESLASKAGLSISDAVRALIRSAEQITPPKPATAVFPGVPVLKMESQSVKVSQSQSD